MDFNKLKEMGLEYAEKGKNAAMDLAERGKTQAKIVSEQAKLAKAQRDYDLLKADVTNTEGNDIADTSPTFKVLEEGATTLSKEESGRLAAHQMKFIRNLEMALVRIENKTYGICRETGKLIPKERLKIVPHATLSIEAKESHNK